MTARRSRQLLGAIAIALLLVAAWAVGTASAAQPLVRAAMYPLTPAFRLADVWPLTGVWQDCAVTVLVGSALIALGSSVRRRAL